jgi:hypothetical protein
MTKRRERWWRELNRGEEERTNVNRSEYLCREIRGEQK